MANVDVRVSFDSKDWKAWSQPEDKNNPAQLKRMIAEWAEQREILGVLSGIDSNPSRALGLLLQSHALLKNAQVVITASPASTPQAEDTDDFEDNTDDF